MQNPPATVAEYNERFQTNQRVSGHGIDGVTMHIPCPWCAAPGFAEWLVIDSERAMQESTTCTECGRTGHTIFHVNEPGRKEFEFVQTDGPDAPDWLKPAPRRLDAAGGQS